MAMVITDDAELEVDAVPVRGAIAVLPADVERITGWELKPEGLCRGDVCVPTRARADALHVDGRIALDTIAELLARPLAVDRDAQVAVLGASAATRHAQLADGRVDDLVLRDRDGAPFEWRAIGRKKKVLVAWASW